MRVCMRVCVIQVWSSGEAAWNLQEKEHQQIRVLVVDLLSLPLSLVSASPSHL